ncbi:MAG: LPS export ABC transporter permease LptG [Rhodocyclaceae bacterium]|nr:LPS export ABC transporter permease LptG [Rhodocyclaceae bacterium]
MKLTVLNRYLARDIVFSSLVVMLALVALFLFFDFINELGDLSGGYGLGTAALYVLLLVPGRAYELFPIGALVGALYALSTLARHSEITVMRASGMSTRHLLGAVALGGAVLVVATFAVGEALAPPSEKFAEQWKLQATGHDFGSRLRSGLWVRDGARFVNVGAVQTDGRLKDVRLYEFDDENRLRSVRRAETGEYDEQAGNWRLQRVRDTQIAPDGSAVQQLYEVEFRWQAGLTPKLLDVLTLVPERMSLPPLLAYIRFLADNGQNADRFRIAFWKKLTYPLSVLVMVLLAVPFALSHQRSSPVSVKIFAGVLLGVAFYLLNGLSQNMGLLAGWPPALSALAPSALFLLAAWQGIRWVERR